MHFAKPEIAFQSWETLYDTPPQFVGAALWCGFDHQRGYHPDPFYGGLTDVFRQPKYSYYLFKSQRDVNDQPFIFIANEMTPISESDIHVFTNCQQVRLILYGQDTIVQDANPDQNPMPHPVVTFKNKYMNMDVRRLVQTGNSEKVFIVAEGLVDGEVVAKHTRTPALRPARIKLEIAGFSPSLVANGSDIITLIASITDEQGNVKRLNNGQIKFEIQGEGRIVDDGQIMANPRKVEWGEAPVLIRSTTTPGEIKVIATMARDGVHSPESDTLVFSTLPSNMPFIFSENEQDFDSGQNIYQSGNDTGNSRKNKEFNDEELKKVEKQQTEFGGGLK